MARTCGYFITGVVTIFCCFCSVGTRSITGECEATNETVSSRLAARQGTNIADPVADLIEGVKLIRRELLSTNWNESAGNSDLSGDGGNDSMITNVLHNCLADRTLIEIIECLNQSEMSGNSSMTRREASAEQNQSLLSIATGKPKSQIDPERQRITKVFLSLNGL